MLPLHSILHPTDFSKCCNFSCHLAASLARDHGAKLLIVHVAPMVRTSTARNPQNNLEAQLWEQLEQLKTEIPALATTHHQMRLIEGTNAADEIIAFSRDSLADLVVMGTHGRTGLRRILMGSVAERVSREAACPVLTVRMVGINE